MTSLDRTAGELVQPDDQPGPSPPPDATDAATGTATDADRQSTLAIVPAYNESGSIADIVSDTSDFVDDVFVIDDSSTDATRDIAKEHADGVISHPKNMGVGAAVHTGYLAAVRRGYDVVVQVDADGQHDPSYIPDLLSTLTEEDADMVIGSRWLNASYQEYTWLRRSGIKFYTVEANLLGGLGITDVTSGFRAYRVSMLDDLQRPESSHWALEQTLEAARKGYEIAEVSVPMPPAPEGSQFDPGTFARYPGRMALITLKVLLFR